jgi:hypothetical protein
MRGVDTKLFLRVAFACSKNKHKFFTVCGTSVAVHSYLSGIKIYVYMVLKQRNVGGRRSLYGLRPHSKHTTGRAMDTKQFGSGKTVCNKIC